MSILLVVARQMALGAVVEAAEETHQLNRTFSMSGLRH
jgi:hypothetical protein